MILEEISKLKSLEKNAGDKKILKAQITSVALKKNNRVII